MGTEFEIVLEKTIDFTDGELYVTTIKENKKFRVEVTNNKACICRLEANRKDIGTIASLTCKRLRTYSDIHAATISLKSVFLNHSPNEIKLLLAAEERISTSAEIGKMMRTMGFRTDTKHGYFKDYRRRGAVTVYVYLDSKEKPFGRFFGTALGDDFEFEKI